MADPNTEKRVQDLNAGWRNYIRDLIGADPNTFQLAQGTLGLQTSDNSGFFRMEDAVPPSSAVGYYDADTTKSRAVACRGLLFGALLSELSPQALRDALGNYYTAWNDWKIAHPRNSGETNSAWLDRWADSSNVDPGLVVQAKSAYNAYANAPLIQAQEAFISAAGEQKFTDTAGNPFNLKIYTATTDGARAAINTGSTRTIDFSSNKKDTSTSSTFVQGSASGFYKIFSGGVSGGFDQEDSKASNSEFTIKGTMKTATLSCGPGTWYPGGEVGRAFSGKNDNNIWDPQSRAGNWDSFFAPSGSLARHVSQLLLVSGYDITVTSKAVYSQSEHQKIQARAEFGIWPFFSASASSTHRKDITLDSNSNLTCRYTLNPGLIQIWGVTVQPQA